MTHYWQTWEETTWLVIGRDEWWSVNWRASSGVCALCNYSSLIYHVTEIWARLLSDCYYLTKRWYLKFIWIGIRQKGDCVSVKEPELFVLWFPSTQVLLLTVQHAPLSFVIPANWPLDLPWQYCHGLSLFLEYFSIIFVVYVMKLWHVLSLFFALVQ